MQIYTDHDSLRGISSTHRLNPRQARWATFLGGFDFEVIHRPGKTNPADGPSRRPDYYTENECVCTLLPTLKSKLGLLQDKPLTAQMQQEIARVVAESGAQGSTTEEISEGTCETQVGRTSGAARPNPTTGYVGCIQQIPRSVARVLLSSNTIMEPLA